MSRWRLRPGEGIIIITDSQEAARFDEAVKRALFGIEEASKSN